MKKYFLGMGLFLAGLASCTNNEVVEVSQNQNAIQFKMPFVENSTRAATQAPVTDLTAAGIEHIHVFGWYLPENEQDVEKAVNPFDNASLEVSKGTDNLFNTNVDWILNQWYSFAAFIDGVDGDAEDWVDDVTFELPTYNTSRLTIPNYEATAHDLVIAMPEDVHITTTSNYAVPLMFKHMLSKVRFTFKNNEQSKFKINVSGIRINNAYKTGTLVADKSSNSVISANWNFTDVVKTGYNYDAIENIKGQEVGYSENYVIPQSTDGLTVTFTINLHELVDNVDKVIETVDYTASLQIGAISNWTFGYAYNYVLSISAEDINPDLSEKIKFSASVSSWDYTWDQETGEGSITITPTPVTSTTGQ